MAMASEGFSKVCFGAISTWDVPDELILEPGKTPEIRLNSDSKFAK